jgi:hypothetical protein
MQAAHHTGAARRAILKVVTGKNRQEDAILCGQEAKWPLFLSNFGEIISSVAAK